MAQGLVRAVAGLSAIFLLVTQPAAVPGQITAQQEYRAKAAFLSNFPSFVEWPAGAFSSPQAPLTICVYGVYAFGISLADSAGGRTAHGRRIEVKWVHKENELRSCHILFVSRSEAKHYGTVLQAIQGASVLTVGETPDFLAAGGTVSLMLQQESLQFEVNLDRANEAHLKLSSRLLALARRVVNKAAEAKS